jgi:hypothetical protein
MANNNSVSDTSILESALIGLQSQHSKIEVKMAEIRRKLGIRAPRTTPALSSAVALPAKRTMSPAARKRIAAAQRKRWAAVRNAPAEPAPKKRKISAAGMKRIIAATKKRWAAVRAQKAVAAKKVKPKSKKAPAAAE